MDIKKSRFSEVKKKMRKMTAVKKVKEVKEVKEKPVKEKSKKHITKKQKISQSVKVNVNVPTTNQAPAQAYQIPNSFNNNDFKNLQNTIIELLNKNNNPTITESFNIPKKTEEVKIEIPKKSSSTVSTDTDNHMISTAQQTTDTTNRDIGNFPQSFKSNKTEDSTIKQNKKNTFTIPTAFIPESPLNFSQLITSKPETIKGLVPSIFNKKEETNFKQTLPVEEATKLLGVKNKPKTFKSLNPPDFIEPEIKKTNKLTQPEQKIEPAQKIITNVMDKFSEKVLNPPLYIPTPKKDKNNLSITERVFGYEGEAMPSSNTEGVPKNYIYEGEAMPSSNTEGVPKEYLKDAKNKIEEIKKHVEENVDDVIKNALTKVRAIEKNNQLEDKAKAEVVKKLKEFEKAKEKYADDIKAKVAEELNKNMGDMIKKRKQEENKRKKQQKKDKEKLDNDVEEMLKNLDDDAEMIIKKVKKADKEDMARLEEQFKKDKLKERFKKVKEKHAKQKKEKEKLDKDVEDMLKKANEEEAKKDKLKQEEMLKKMESDRPKVGRPKNTEEQNAQREIERKKRLLEGKKSISDYAFNKLLDKVEDPIDRSVLTDAYDNGFLDDKKIKNRLKNVGYSKDEIENFFKKK